MLKGLRVLDFTRLLPGPAATHMLGAMGATVTKVEAEHRLDSVRQTHPSLFHALNHNKENWLVNYETEEGRDLVLERARNSDVFVEQFRPGSMDAWGLGYKDLYAVNKDIVYVSIRGYGEKGELCNVAGHDINYLATSGLLSQLKSESGKPVVPGFQIADVAGGAYATLVAMQAALVRRGLSPEAGGSHVCVDMTAACVPLLSVPLSLEAAGLPNILDGHTAVNYGVYETADNKFLAVGAMLDMVKNSMELHGTERPVPQPTSIYREF